ncbi:MAG: L-sorbosone dehydrogenase [Aureliella sp.]
MRGKAAGQESETLRVVLLGDGLIEQEQYSGWIESLVTTSFADTDLSFRNIGWNGDTPTGDSRLGLSLVQAGNESPGEGWRQLVKQLELTQPDVLVVGYGMASGLEAVDKYQLPDAAAEQFEADCQQLIAKAREISPEVEFVFVTPISHMDADNAAAKFIDRFAQSIRSIGKQHLSTVLDLHRVDFSASERKDAVHLNEAGYKAAAIAIAEEMSLDDSVLESPQIEALRQQILRKNEWWFHRSRPANMAYVFGFRKHEQGQNATEIPQFDTLIEQEEARIAQLRTLDETELDIPEPRRESKYAEFTPQPVPEFTVAPGWEITLWAQNPLLNKPIHMNFDPQGRLWVASSEAYPMIEVGQSAPDKVVVLEDTTGDGVADSSTVFAEGLLIPTSIAPGNGGVYVAQSTDLLFLKDTDGDGKADVRQRVLSGFGTEDTHHNLHTLRWGPDGRLYMNQSVYTRTDTETPHGVVRLRAGGGLRLDTQRMEMEIFFRGLWNSWGHQFDRYGQSFLSDGAGFAGLGYTFPGATFRPTPGVREQLDLISPGNWPKFASLEVVGGKAYPASWQGSLITCDFRANRVARFSLADDGAGFVTKQEDDLVRTSAATFRPIDVKQGPDGALYIADWSNPIINHGEVDFRDSRRDRWHGRIWRVKWVGDGAPVDAPAATIAGASTKQLLDNLLSEDGFVRDQSRRLAFEQPQETKRELPSWTERNTSPVARLEALWIHEGLDIANEDLLRECLSAEDARIRAAAVRVLSHWSDPATALGAMVSELAAMELLSASIRDSHPRVRLESVRGLARLGTADAAQLALGAVDQPVDRFVDHALTLTIRELADPLMQRIENGQWPESSDDIAETKRSERQLETVLTKVDPKLASGYLSKKLAADGVPADGSGPWIDLIAAAGQPRELDMLLASISDGMLDPAATAKALRALAKAQRLRKVRPASKLGRVAQLVKVPDDGIRLAALELVGLWKMGGQSALVQKVALDEAVGENVQRAAVDALRAIGGKPASAALGAVLQEAESAAIGQAAALALASVDPQKAAEPLLQLLAGESEEEPALALWRRILSSRNVGKVVAPQLAAAKLPQHVIAAGLRAMNDGGRNEQELSAALSALSTAAAKREWTAELQAEYVAMLPDADPHRGELIYRRKELACTSCHAIGGIGGRVGPDMTSLGASAPADYIVESIFAPNAKIKEGFHSVSVATEDGRVFTGIEIKSDSEEIVLRDSNNKEQSIPQSEVIGKKAAASLMPTGVVDRLSINEQADLLRFLTELGKPGPFDASAGGVARSLEIFAGTHRIEQQGAEKITRGEVDGWKSVAAMVDGTLSRDELQELTRQPINIALVHVYARSHIQQAEASEATFTISSPLAALWVDGKEVEATETTSDSRLFKTELTAGHHVVIARLDARELPSKLKITSDNSAFVTAESVATNTDQ